MIILKTEDEFVDYMWKLYPNDNQLPLREAMRLSFDFLVGRYDFSERERKKIQNEIKQKMSQKYSITLE
jgi:hypothetical protein